MGNLVFKEDLLLTELALDHTFGAVFLQMRLQEPLVEVGPADVGTLHLYVQALCKVFLQNKVIKSLSYKGKSRTGSLKNAN